MRVAPFVLVLSPLLSQFGGSDVAGMVSSPNAMRLELYRPLGIGMLVGAAVGGIVAAFPLIVSAMKSMHAAGKKSEADGRTNDEMPIGLLYGAIAIGAAVMIWIAYQSVDSMTLGRAAAMAALVLAEAQVERGDSDAAAAVLDRATRFLESIDDAVGEGQQRAVQQRRIFPLQEPEPAEPVGLGDADARDTPPQALRKRLFGSRIHRREGRRGRGEPGGRCREAGGAGAGAQAGCPPARACAAWARPSPRRRGPT